MHVRRVVTGTAEGRSTVVLDELIAPIRVGLLPGAEFHALGGADEATHLPIDGADLRPKAWFPPAAGFRFALVTMPPDGAGYPDDFDFGAALVEIGDRLPGMAETFELDNPGMHTTDTVDCATIISGHITLELDDGETTELHPGDCVIQSGTRHAWRNTGPEPCVMAVTIVGATRAG